MSPSGSYRGNIAPRQHALPPSRSARSLLAMGDTVNHLTEVITRILGGSIQGERRLGYGQLRP